MSRLKHAALQLGFQAGLFRLVQRAVRRRQAVILTFHRFSGNGEGHARGIPIQRFAEDMEYLTRHYRIVSLSTVVEELARGAVQPYTVAVTVDDGHQEVATLAAPVLRRYGVPASIFVVSNFIDGRLWLWPDRFAFVFEHALGGRVTFSHAGSRHVLELDRGQGREQALERWLAYAKALTTAERDELLETIAEAAGVSIPVAPPDEYRPMTWAQLRALAAEGFDVGAHTSTHPILSRVTPEQLRVEVEDCKEQIERRLGHPVRHFAYPNGRREDYTPEAVAAVARAGYVAAVTTVFGGNAPGTPAFELRRIVAPPESVAAFARSLSGFDEIRMQLGSRSARVPPHVAPVGHAARATGNP